MSTIAEHKPSIKNLRNSSGESFDPRLLWIVFRRNWYWSTPIGIALAVASAAIVWSIFIPNYLASHLLEANREYVVFPGLMQAPTDLVQNERPLIQNNFVLASVLADAKICEAPSLRDPISREYNLKRNLSIGDLGTRTMMMVSYRDTDPVAAAEVCNAIVRSYLRQRQKLDDRHNSQLEGWLQPAVALWHGEVEELRNRIITLSKQAKGFDPFQESSRINADAEYFNSLHDELSKLRTDEIILVAELAILKEAQPAGGLSELFDPHVDQIESAVENNPDVQRVSSLIEEKQSEMRKMERDDLKLRRKSWYDGLETEVSALEKELKKAKMVAEPIVLERLKKKLQSNSSINKQAVITSKEQDVANIRIRREVFERDYATEETRLAKYAGETAELYFAQQKYLQASKISERLEERVASLRTERQKSSTMQTIAEALPPTMPEDSSLWKVIAMIAAAAFAFPLGLALLFELRSKRLATAASLESINISNVLGEVACLPSGVHSGRRYRIYEESIETVRINISLAKGMGDMRSILVTSGMSGEGKSSLASNLAVSVARSSDTPTLLIDADLRNPDQHNLFGMERGPGLASVLLGKSSLEDAINRTLGNRLHVLTSGFLECHPHRFVSEDAVRELMEQVKSKYKFVIFDTAPVLAAGETLRFASVADATIVCVLRDVSRQDHLSRCLKRLNACRANVIGTVFCGVPTSQYTYRYGDYRYALTSTTNSL